MTDIVSVGFRVETGELDKANTKLKSMGTIADSAERKVTGATASMSAGFSKLQSIISGLAASMLASKVLKDVDAWTSLNNQLRVVIDSESELVSIRSKLNDVSEATRTGLSTTVELYSSIAKSTKEMNLSSNDAITITQTLNNLFLAGGKTVAETAGAITQLSQGLASGVLRGDEFNSVAEGAPMILDAISASTGIARGELRDFAADGGITAEILVTALQNYSGEAQALADKTLPTLAQSIQLAEDNFIEWAGTNDTLTDASGALGKSLVTLSKNIDATVSAATAATGVYVTYLALIGEGSVLARGKAAAAMISEEAAKRRLIAATVSETQAEIALLTTQKAMFANMILRIKNETQRAVIRTQLAKATLALTAAETRLTAATAAQAAATTALGTAVRFLMGPWGLLITAVAAGAAAFISSKSDSDELTSAIGRQKTAISELKDEYDALTRAGQAKFWTESNSAIVAQLQNITALRAEISKVSSSTTDGIVGVDAGKLASLNAQLKESEKTLTEIRERQQALFSDSMSNNWKSVEDSTAKASANVEKIESSAKTFNDLFGGTDTVDPYLQSQFQEYESYIESINSLRTADDVSADIEKLNAAIASGRVYAEEGVMALKTLQDEYDSLTGETKDVTTSQNDLTNASVATLQSISNLFETGSEDAQNLVLATNLVTEAMAIQAAVAEATAATVSAALTGGISLIASMNSIFGGDFEDLSAEIQENQYLNMWGEKSDAISEATESSASSLDDLVGINTDMLDALSNLTDAITSASGIITTSSNGVSVNTSGLYEDNIFGLSGGFLETALLDTVGSLIGYAVAGPFGSIVGSFLGEALNTVGSWLGGSSSVTDSGIKIIGDTLGNLIDDTLVLAYQTVSYKTWAWGSTKKATSTADAGDEVSNQISLVFSSLADSVYEAGIALGYSSSYLTDAINSFVVDTATISLDDLSTDEQIAELEAYFSDVFNDLAENTIPWLEDLQETGEELGTTLTRVATEVSILNYAVDNLGVVANGSVEEIAYAADAISDLLGGSDSFSEYLSSFISNFASDAELIEIYANSLSDALGDVGLSLPSSADGFYDLLNAIDATTDAGQEQIATILSLTDTASEYYSMTDSFAETLESAYETLKDLDDDSDIMDFASGLAYLNDVIESGLIDTSDEFEDAVSAISDLSADMFSSAEDYAYAQAIALNTVSDLYDLTGESLTDSERQLETLTAIQSSSESSLSELTTLKEKISEMLTVQNKQTAYISEFTSLMNDMMTIGVTTR